MTESAKVRELIEKSILSEAHGENDYFSVLRQLVASREKFTPESDEYRAWQSGVDEIYARLHDEISHNSGRPVVPVKFGTSGWRGILGKDLFVKSVGQVTRAILDLYHDPSPEMQEALGVSSLAEAQKRGCVLGFDNRFGGEIMAKHVDDILTGNGFKVHYAGESTTGVLSAALLELEAAFSINLTPSHNPLEYGGFKFNAADAGPAAKIITDQITANSNRIIKNDPAITTTPNPALSNKINSLALWINFVRKGSAKHHLDYDRIMENFLDSDNLVVAVDSVHGASRNHIRRIFGERDNDRLLLIRQNNDPTFGGIAPEPSAKNMKQVSETLASRSERLKLGMIIDPDGDRIRFTDGRSEIEMNKFGAAAYHYLHVHKGLTGPVAKSVATSNFANAVAAGLQDDVFESRVGFKEFKPVIGKALVCFEESDGISVIGHTPEKDAYIGLILALDMTMSLNMNLSEYITNIENEFGAYHPDRDSVTVGFKGKELTSRLDNLGKYTPGTAIKIDDETKTIAGLIDIDGHKLVMDDGSWLMIRPSGTEPKVRIYVEARTASGRKALLDKAHHLLAETGATNGS